MTVFIRRAVSLLLLLLLICQSLPALGQEAGSPEAGATGDSAVKYIAAADVALKVRRGPSLEQSGVDSIRKGDPIYLISLGTEWSQVRTSQTTGYVQSKYLKNIRSYDPLTGQAGEEALIPQEIIDYTVGSTEDFRMGFKAYAVKVAHFYTEPDEKSRYVTKVPMYEEVIVSHVEGDWCYAKYGKRVGWVLTKSLFKWDRIDPYAGDIPGCIVYPTLAFVGQTTDILDYATNVAGKKKDKVLKTINPGSAICVEAPDEEGRYKTPYWRTTGFITQEDIVYTMDVVPYEDAQPGDLICAMTTYYAVGVHTLQYQGRNWNIYLASSLLSDLILQPNEMLNVNKIIGPYRKSTGYKPAPIASPTALWGYGGGTCQVNTTLYNTVIRLPIFVNHRKVHANVGAKYMLKGFDAAVGGGDINMIFTNTLPYAIRFNFFISDGVLTCCIFRV